MYGKERTKKIKNLKHKHSHFQVQTWQLKCQVTDPEGAPDVNCSILCQCSCMTVPCRHLHHLLLQRHLSWNHLRAFLSCIPTKGSFIITAKSVDLYNERERVRRVYTCILEMQKLIGKLFGGNNRISPCNYRKNKKRQQNMDPLHCQCHWRRQCACLQLPLAQPSLAGTRGLASSSGGRPHLDPTVQHLPGPEQEPGPPLYHDFCGKLLHNFTYFL